MQENKSKYSNIKTTAIKVQKCVKFLVLWLQLIMIEYISGLAGIPALKITVCNWSLSR
ncbi:hypothetical protein BHECKSOX2_205 [Bathymodiolus heckerae thiotrophic gill symbiont]|nr:hypothetical protein BHECKSOX2_205 [Bathymodiolus heckerae thiotrophic gill symbiont]